MMRSATLFAAALLLCLTLPAAASHYSLLELAGMYVARGNVATALDLFARAIAAEPTNISAYEARAFYYLKLERPEDALDDFSAVLALAPKYVAGYLSRGLVYSQLGQSDKARADFAMACTLGDNSGCSFAKGE